MFKKLTDSSNAFKKTTAMPWHSILSKGVAIIAAIACLTAITSCAPTKPEAPTSPAPEPTISVKVVDKLNIDNTAEFNVSSARPMLKIRIENTYASDVLEVSGWLSVYDHEGDMISSAEHVFSKLIKSNSSEDFFIELKSLPSASHEDLLYADLEDISAKFKINKISYADSSTARLDGESVTILELSPESDGVSTYVTLQNNAMELFNNEKYAEALPIIERLYYYSVDGSFTNEYVTCLIKATPGDPYDRILGLLEREEYYIATKALGQLAETNDQAKAKLDEIVAAKIAESEEYASVGDYESARVTIGPICAEQADKLELAYLYAHSGDLQMALQCGLTVLLIPEGTEQIPDDAFSTSGYLVSCLKKVILPSSLKSIGSHAFTGHYHLSEIVFPEGLVEIGAGAFVGCQSLPEELDLKSVKTIGKNAFAGCASIKRVIGDNLTLLGNGAFIDCSSLETITLGNGLTEISNYCFSECTSLQTIALPQGIKKIGECAFNKCSSLTTVSLNSDLSEIGEDAFMKCSALTEITIPASVTKIGARAFQLTSLTNAFFDDPTGWKLDSQQATPVNVQDPESIAAWMEADNTGIFKDPDLGEQ